MTRFFFITTYDKPLRGIQACKCDFKCLESYKSSAVFSLRWNYPSVGVASRNDWGSEFQLVGPTLQNCVVHTSRVLVRGTAR